MKVYGETLNSRLMVGTSGYPSPKTLSDTVAACKAEVITVSVRRESVTGRSGQRFWSLIQELGVRVLPNTAGCRTVKEAVTTAQMAREIFDTPWVKLEVIGNDNTLHPDVFGLVEAARILAEDGFCVFPYTTEDLTVADKLLAAGCEVLMPWGAPIGCGRGLDNPHGIERMRAQFPDVPLVVDAGLGLPSHATRAVELGCDAVLVNTAIAKAVDPVAMGQAFAFAVDAGWVGRQAGPVCPRESAVPSTPVLGQAMLA